MNERRPPTVQGNFMDDVVYQRRCESRMGFVDAARDVQTQIEYFLQGFPQGNDFYQLGFWDPIKTTGIWDFQGILTSIRRGGVGRIILSRGMSNRKQKTFIPNVVGIMEDGREDQPTTVVKIGEIKSLQSNAQAFDTLRQYGQQTVDYELYKAKTRGERIGLLISNYVFPSGKEITPEGVRGVVETQIRAWYDSVVMCKKTGKNVCGNTVYDMFPDNLRVNEAGMPVIFDADMVSELGKVIAPGMVSGKIAELIAEQFNELPVSLEDAGLSYMRERKTLVFPPELLG